jgi:hypothetical protein
LKYFGNTEVNQHDMLVLVDHDIGGLHVAEYDRIGTVAVQVMKHVAKLDCPSDDLLFREERLGLR